MALRGSRHLLSASRAGPLRPAARGLAAAARPRLVVALGGNALLRRGEPLTMENQAAAAAAAGPMLVALSKTHDVVLVHGNGPQVGALALMEQAYSVSTGTAPYPLDVLGAETQGQIGYVISTALQNTPGCGQVASIVTQIVVDTGDPAFSDPSKPVGAVYTEEEAKQRAGALGWNVKKDGEHYRRVVPSPRPVDIVQLPTIKALVDLPDTIVICCGGGGAPMVKQPNGQLQGVEAVIDKDMCAALVASKLGADGLVILTDGGGIWQNFGKPDAREMCAVTPEYLTSTGAGQKFPGSMAPKVTACVDFVAGRAGATPSGATKTANRWAAIGSLSDAEAIIAKTAGTVIKHDVEEGVQWR